MKPAGTRAFTCSNPTASGALPAYRISAGKPATVRVTGSGDTQVSASGSLNVPILGSGDVAYSGSPKLNASIAGSGKVNPASQ